MVPSFNTTNTSATELFLSNIRCAACSRMSSWSREIVKQ